MLTFASVATAYRTWSDTTYATAPLEVLLCLFGVAAFPSAERQDKGPAHTGDLLTDLLGGVAATLRILRGGENQRGEAVTVDAADLCDVEEKLEVIAELRRRELAEQEGGPTS